MLTRCRFRPQDHPRRDNSPGGPDLDKLKIENLESLKVGPLLAETRARAAEEGHDLPTLKDEPMGGIVQQESSKAPTGDGRARRHHEGRHHRRMAWLQSSPAVATLTQERRKAEAEELSVSDTSKARDGGRDSVRGPKL